MSVPERYCPSCGKGTPFSVATCVHCKMYFFAQQPKEEARSLVNSLNEVILAVHQGEMSLKAGVEAERVLLAALAKKAPSVWKTPAVSLLAKVTPEDFPNVRQKPQAATSGADQAEIAGAGQSTVDSSTGSAPVEAPAVPPAAWGPRPLAQDGALATLSTNAEEEEEEEEVAQPAFSFDEQGPNLLLYLGAFLICVSAFIFVNVSGEQLSPVVKLLALVGGTLSFLAAGWKCTQLPKVRSAGSTFLTIGAVLIPLDVLAYYTLDAHVSPLQQPTVWLLASIAACVLYAKLRLDNYGQRYGLMFGLAWLSAHFALGAVFGWRGQNEAFVILGATGMTLALLHRFSTKTRLLTEDLVGSALGVSVLGLFGSTLSVIGECYVSCKPTETNLRLYASLNMLALFVTSMGLRTSRVWLRTLPSWLVVPAVIALLFPFPKYVPAICYAHVLALAALIYAHPKAWLKLPLKAQEVLPYVNKASYLWGASALMVLAVTREGPFNSGLAALVFFTLTLALLAHAASGADEKTRVRYAKPHLQGAFTSFTLFISGLLYTLPWVKELANAYHYDAIAGMLLINVVLSGVVLLISQPGNVRNVPRRLLERFPESSRANIRDGSFVTCVAASVGALLAAEEPCTRVSVALVVLATYFVILRKVQASSIARVFSLGVSLLAVAVLVISGSDLIGLTARSAPSYLVVGGVLILGLLLLAVRKVAIGEAGTYTLAALATLNAIGFTPVGSFHLVKWFPVEPNPGSLLLLVLSVVLLVRTPRIQALPGVIGAMGALLLVYASALLPPTLQQPHLFLLGLLVLRLTYNGRAGSRRYLDEVVAFGAVLCVHALGLVFVGKYVLLNWHTLPANLGAASVLGATAVAVLAHPKLGRLDGVAGSAFIAALFYTSVALGLPPGGAALLFSITAGAMWALGRAANESSLRTNAFTILSGSVFYLLLHKGLDVHERALPYLALVVIFSSVLLAIDGWKDRWGSGLLPAAVALIIGVGLEVMRLQPSRLEAYTLPAAVLLLALGLASRRQGRLLPGNNERRALETLGAILLVGPTFIEQTDVVGALVVLTGAILLLAIGLPLRLRHIVLVASGAIGLEGLRLANTVIQQLPSWALAGIAGALLLGVGFILLLRKEWYSAATLRLRTWWDQSESTKKTEL